MALGIGNDIGVEVTQGVADAVNQAQLYQDSSILYHFRDMQRRQVEYIKKRVVLLEKGLNAEYLKEYYGEMKINEVTSEVQENGQKVADVPNARSTEIPSQVIDHLPPIEVIASEKISAAACNNDADRLELPQHYNKMCKILEDNVHEAVQSSLDLKKNLHSLEEICGDISQILSPAQHYPHTSEQPALGTAARSQMESLSTAAESVSPPNQQPAVVTEIEMEDSPRESEPEKHAILEEIDIDLTGSDPLKHRSKIEDSDTGPDPIKKGSKSACNVSASAGSSQIDPECLSRTTENYAVMMEETGNEYSGKTDAAASGTERSTEKSEAGVIVLDD